MRPDEEQQALVVKEQATTPAQALHQSLTSHLFDDPVTPVPLYWRIYYYAALALYYATLIAALFFAAPSGEPYWPIGRDCLEDVFGLTGDSPLVKVPEAYLGASGVVTNSLFNMWVMLRYLEGNWKPANQAEKILYRASRGWHHRFRKAALYGEAVFANLALSYLSYQEEGKVDFWFVNAAIIGFFIAYVSLDLFVDSSVWFANTLKQFAVDLQRLVEGAKNPAHEDLRAIMQEYFSKLHRKYKKNRFANMPRNREGFFCAVESSGQRSETVTQFLRRHFFYALPYLAGGGLSFLLLGSRLGIAGKAHDAAIYITDEWIRLEQEIARKSSIWIITALAAAPPVAFGFKAFSALGRALYNAGLQMITHSSGDKSVARQTYPKLWWPLFLGSGLFVAGSWAGNVDLTYEYAQEYITVLMLYFTITASAAVVTNGFGVKNLIDDVIARFARFYRWWGSGDNYTFANEEKFFSDYERLLQQACQDPKKAIEFLIYFPEVRNQVKCMGFNRFAEVAAEVSFTYEEMQNIRKYLNKDEFYVRSLLGQLGFTPVQMNSFFEKPVVVETAGTVLPFWKRAVPSAVDCMPRNMLGCYR